MSPLWLSYGGLRLREVREDLLAWEVDGYFLLFCNEVKLASTAATTLFGNKQLIYNPPNQLPHTVIREATFA